MRFIKDIEERIKNGITSTYGEFAISVFSGLSGSEISERNCIRYKKSE